MQNITIKLNHRPYSCNKGATISVLMAENNYDFPSIVVKLNGVVVEDELWTTSTVSDGDNVEIIHVFGGG